jgi:hypothetical protein
LFLCVVLTRRYTYWECKEYWEGFAGTGVIGSPGAVSAVVGHCAACGEWGVIGVRAVLRHKKQDLWYIIGYFTLAEARADIDSSGICLFQNPNTKYAGIGGNRGCGVCASRCFKDILGKGSMRGIRIYRFFS